MDATIIAKQSEFALAAYANLQPGVPSEIALQDNGKGMSPAQASEFSSRYIVLAQFNDTAAEGGLGTSFSATVFKDAVGNLTLAIRGTLELTGSPSDATTDLDIAISGAGYDQIVAMTNWWLRASAPASQSVLQYKIVPGPLDPHNGIQFGTRWLQILSPVSGTGKLASDIGADPDHKLDITGHSLGGHLAMAFGALFPNATNEVTVFAGSDIRWGLAA